MLETWKKVTIVNGSRELVDGGECAYRGRPYFNYGSLLQDMKFQQGSFDVRLTSFPLR